MQRTFGSKRRHFYIHVEGCIKLIKSAGEEYQVLKRGREYKDCGEKFTVKKGKEEAYHLPYNIKTVGKDIKRGGWKGRLTLLGGKSKF